MVYYFTSNVVSPSAFIYVGKDKVESESALLHDRWTMVDRGRDEDLIRFGFDEDVW